jgi:5'-nucleotidase
MSRRRILITNDDGYQSEGIEALIRAFSRIAEVIVVAPLSERSCSSHSITAHKPLRAKEVEIAGVRGFAIDGTPVDAVILGLNVFCNDGVDFLVSGINRGPNLGFDVFYSGTVAAALEGAISGIPSLAVSLAISSWNNYELAAHFAVKIWEDFSEILERERDLVLNVNVPDLPDLSSVRGVAVTELGDRFYFTVVKERSASEPGWKEFVFEEDKKERTLQRNTDFFAVYHSWVSVTPLRPYLTDYRLCEELASRVGVVEDE